MWAGNELMIGPWLGGVSGSLLDPVASSECEVVEWNFHQYNIE